MLNFISYFTFLNIMVILMLLLVSKLCATLLRLRGL